MHVLNTNLAPKAGHGKLIAVVDLGSNSFHLIVGRVVFTDGDLHIKKIDAVKEQIKLADGLDSGNMLTTPYMVRAINCLTRFSERLRSFLPDDVRVVGTNTFRVAKNIGDFLPNFEKALGFPISVISGVEEARLIYKGVCNALDLDGQQKLVIDIGGGSTEFIVGKGQDAKLLKSVYVGTSKISNEFFSGGKVSKRDFDNAVLLARREIQVITKSFRSVGWDLAYGCSGTIKSISEVCQMNSLGDRITLVSLKKLVELMTGIKNLGTNQVAGLKTERISSFPAGVAILTAIFLEFKVRDLELCTAALRTGVLFEIAGRGSQQDQRDRTVKRFLEQFDVDRVHASRVSHLAVYFCKQLVEVTTQVDKEVKKIIHWTALLSEVGHILSHNAYHRHSAYIVTNSDMPGFSKMEQALMGNLILGHSGKLQKVAHMLRDHVFVSILLCLRLSAIFLRSRTDLNLPVMIIRGDRKSKSFVLEISKEWMDNHPLTAFTLKQEVREWKKVNFLFSISCYFLEEKKAISGRPT